MNNRTIEKITHEDGSHGEIVTYVSYETVNNLRNVFSTREEEQVIAVASGARGSGSGVYHQITHTTERRWKQGQYISIETTVHDQLQVSEFTEEGKQQNELYKARMKCDHVDKGTYVLSWGAGCSADSTRYCSFCNQPV